MALVVLVVIPLGCCEGAVGGLGGGEVDIGGPGVVGGVSGGVCEFLGLGVELHSSLVAVDIHCSIPIESPIQFLIIGG